MGEIVGTQLCQHHHHLEVQRKRVESRGSPQLQIKSPCPLCHQEIIPTPPDPLQSNGDEEPEIVVKLRPATFKEKSVNVLCPHCQELVKTEINLTEGFYTWYIAGCMFVMGFCLVFPWFCCCIPFIADRFKDVQHYCPNCGRLIHTFKRMDM